MNIFVKSRIDFVQSLNLTIASPITAVTSNKLKSNIPRIVVTALKANLNAPPVIVETKSRIANNPLNVRLNLSTVSSSIFRVVENLWNAVIKLNKLLAFSFVDFGGNTSFHAVPIVLNTDKILLPIFSNPLSNNQRPLILSILSMNSFNGIPSLSAVAPSSLNAAICLSV